MTYAPHSVARAAGSSVYRSYPPSPALAKSVSVYFSIEHRTEEERVVRVFPDGCMDVTFHLERGLATFSGTNDAPVVHRVAGPHRMFGVRFTPGGARELLRVAASEIPEGWQPLELLLGRDAREVGERVAGAADDRARIEVIEAFLRARIEGAIDPRIARAVTSLVESHGAVSIAELARESCTTERHLSRLFQEWVGLRPKQLARVVRFQAMLARMRTRAKRDIDWASLAVELGFADQAHLVREAGKLGGASPTALVESSSDLFNTP